MAAGRVGSSVGTVLTPLMQIPCRSNMNPLICRVHVSEKRWSAEFGALRQLCLATELSEELNWGQACCDFERRNIVVIHGFKHYCALRFMKGALLHDPNDILVQQTKNVQAARQIRFADSPGIDTKSESIKR